MPTVNTAEVRQRGGQVTHGRSRSPEYRVWHMMLQRCENPNSPNYAYYGGRGIKVCRAWHDFAIFFRDMGPRPSAAHQLDRKRNSRGYSKANCRWATRQTNQNNTRRNRYVRLEGVKVTLAEAVRITGINRSTLMHRIRLGLIARTGLFAPVKGTN